MKSQGRRNETDIERRDRKKRYRKVVTCLAAVVVFVTTYALVLPAMTLDDQKADKTPGIDTGAKVEESVSKDESVDKKEQDVDKEEPQKPDGEKASSKDDPSKGGEANNPDQNKKNDSSAEKKNQKKTDSDSAKSGSAVKDLKKDSEIELIKEKTELTYEGSGYKIVAEVGEDAKLPADTKLKVKEIKKDTKDENGEKYDYDAYCEDALEAVRNKDGEEAKDQKREVMLFDISFDSKTVKEGGLEPEAPVKVKIVFDKALDTDDKSMTRAVHFDKRLENLKDEEREKVKKEVLDTQAKGDKKDEMKEASFKSDKFSVYGVVYTVDFHWDVDGEQFEYSIPGGGFISFTELVDILGIGGQKDEESSDVQTNEFVAGVETIEFSSPELMDVSRAEEDTTVGQIKESRGLECEYSSELTEEQIEEIDAKEVKAGDWALISLKPFNTEETLTVTMKNGEKFEIRVTDVSYQGEKVTDPDGKTVALLNLTNNNALMSTAHSTVQGRLLAEDIQVTGNRISSYVPLSTWTFTIVPNTTDQYYIQASNGYLNIGNNGGAYISNQPQALLVQQDNNGRIRIKHPNSNHAINNNNNQTANGYGTWDGSTWPNNNGYQNPGEWFTMYEIGEPVVPHVTVHYVDRDGNELTDVEYTGNNPLVTKNSNGTFNIPYDWSGQTNETSVDLRAQFSKEGWTYANTHLAGKDAAGKELTYDGYVIDSELTRSGTNLQFKSDSGSTWGFSPAGNLKYGSLSTFDLSQTVQATPSVNGSRITYAESANKDIYVILDPPAEHSAGGGSGGSGLDIDDPSFKKEMEPNDDGTYTLSLEVKPHAKNASETNKANVLFIVDTSSSMRATTTSGRRNRIMDTHDAVLEFGDKLLAYNEDHPGAVEVSMITFDGGVNERLDWTSDKAAFDTSVNDYLKYYYLHTGTDWEDGMKTGLDKILTDTDDDPTFVVFFTDGEPSQYSNFHGSGKNENADPTGTHTGATDPGSGYPDFFSYFLSREASKDEMRAVVNTGAKLYGIYAYNSTNDGYQGYNGREDGALMLHNAIRYGYNTTSDLTNNKFFEAKNTNDVKKAFDEVFNSITETVGLSNLVVRDGIAAGVTSSAVVDGDVSAFTYIIKNKSGDVDYKVTVAPNGVTDDMDPVVKGTPIFTIGTGPPVVGEKKQVTVTKIKTDNQGQPILDSNNKIQTEDVQMEVYYYKDASDKEYIMPIATTGENVAWDLSPLGILKDGYTYEVNFVVWPNQESYDLVADLNNGKRPDLEEHWEDMPVLYDKDGKAYRKGGIAEYPFISRYDPTDDTPAIYSAMSNTEQTMDYYVIDRKSVEGEEEEVITGPFNNPIDPPDPMPLTASESQIEKVWNVDRNPAILTELLYGNKDEHGEWIPYSIRFGVYQDDSTEEYTHSTLGWQEGWDKETHDYEWLDAPEENNVTYGGKGHKVGTRWAQDFAIATGLMLSNERMEALGLDKESYPHFEYGDTTYYVLESGHDYRLEESPKMGYEFDYSAPVYHPMLVDGKLQSVTFSKGDDGKFTGITDMTNEQNGLSSLKVENTLRGYIHLNKVVVDKDGKVVNGDKTKFHYTIRMENPAPVFDSDHIPWYGVNGLFYHDDDFNYYQAYIDEHGDLKICTESGGLDHPYDATVSGTFDPNNVTGQEITFDDGSGERTVTIKGNRTTAASDMKSAQAEMWINQDETLNIANVPLGTEYTITEAQNSGYELAGIVSNQPEATTISGSTITGTIVQNADNNVTYKNQIKPGALKITKNVVDEENPENTVHVDGSYIFKVTSEEGLTPAVTRYVQITVENGAAVSYKVAETEAALAAAESQSGSSAIITGLKEGDYTIEEVDKNGLMLADIERGDEVAEAVDEDNCTVTVHVTGGDEIAENLNAQATFTNAYYKNDGPDKITLDIVKTFVGISSLDDVPDGNSGFEVVIGYTLNGAEKTITLQKGSNETNADGISIKAMQDEETLTIRWHITNIPNEAKDFKIKEVRHDGIPGYDLTVVTLDGTEITDAAGDWHDMTVNAPTATLDDVTGQRNTSDSPSELKYVLEDNDVILSKLTSNEGTMVISKKSLNSVQREAVIKGWPSQGGFKKNKIHWFSIEEHPDGFSFGGKTIKFSTRESDGKTIVEFTSNAAAHEYVFAINYHTDEELNNASITNEYSPKKVSLEIVKVEKGSGTKIPGAQFTIRKVKRKLGPSGVTYAGEESAPVTTDGNGFAQFDNITQGYYEIRESKVPAGYISTGDRCFYIRVDGGVISLIEKDLSKADLKDWTTKPVVGNVTFTAAAGETAASAQVENEPGPELPSSGGPGTTWMYLIGSLLTLMAGVTLTARRRMRCVKP